MHSSASSPPSSSSNTATGPRRTPLPLRESMALIDHPTRPPPRPTPTNSPPPNLQHDDQGPKTFFHHTTERDPPHFESMFLRSLMHRDTGQEIWGASDYWH